MNDWRGVKVAMGPQDKSTCIHAYAWPEECQAQSLSELNKLGKSRHALGERHTLVNTVTVCTRTLCAPTRTRGYVSEVSYGKYAV